MEINQKQIPNWSIAVLLLWPCLYFANALFPWSVAIRNHDYSYFPALIKSILVLHWIGVLVALYFLRKNNLSLKDIGYSFKTKQTIYFVASYFLPAFAIFILFKQRLVHDALYTTPMQLQTTGGWILWIFASFSAGICEELIYRGFGITTLLMKGMNKWLALLITSVAFLFIHGPSVLHLNFLTIFRFLFGIAMGVLFLWKKKLWVTMCIHMWYDLLFAVMIALFINR